MSARRTAYILVKSCRKQDEEDYLSYARLPAIQCTCVFWGKQSVKIGLSGTYKTLLQNDNEIDDDRGTGSRHEDETTV